MFTVKKRQILRMAALLGGLAMLVCQWGCPKCITRPLEVQVNDGQPDDVVEWSRDGSPFQACYAYGDGRYSCGELLEWGACGPNESDYTGAYTVSVRRAGQETQGATTITELSCTSPTALVVDTSFLNSPPPEEE